MKSAVCYEFGQRLVVKEVVIDPPKAGGVKVKLAACAICHSDIHYAEGAWGGTLPAIYGHGADGVVTEVGPGVTQTLIGAHVVVTLMRSVRARLSIQRKVVRRQSRGRDRHRWCGA